MKIVRIETVKDLVNLIKDLPEDTPVGEYHANYWTPALDKGINMTITSSGLAANIDYSHNY